jgi:hypothetical protein
MHLLSSSHTHMCTSLFSVQWESVFSCNCLHNGHETSVLGPTYGCPQFLASHTMQKKKMLFLHVFLHHMFIGQNIQIVYSINFVYLSLSPCSFLCPYAPSWLPSFFCFSAHQLTLCSGVLLEKLPASHSITVNAYYGS